MELVWYPANGEPPISFGGDGSPYWISRLEGLASALAEPMTVRAPSQLGDTAVDVSVPVRVVELTVASIMDGPDGKAYDRRSQLSRALTALPARLGDDVALGRLRVVRGEGLPALELPALPRNSPRESVMPGRLEVLHDIQWLCPYPFWMEVADSFALLEQSGGFQFAVEFPLEMTSNNIEIEVDNAGDVDAPILARLYGDVTTARLRNLTTGEEIEITGQITADQYVEVNTAFGAKKIELVTISTGARVSVFNRLNLAKADFWQLRPGVNRVRFEADTNVSGQATVHWRQRYAGI